MVVLGLLFAGVVFCVVRLPSVYFLSCGACCAVLNWLCDLILLFCFGFIVLVGFV